MFSKQIGCNLVGGLKLLGFFFYSPKMDSKMSDIILTKLKEHVPFINNSKEFSSPDLFFLAHAGKHIKVEQFGNQGPSITLQISKFKAVSDMVSSLRMYIDRTFFVEEKLGSHNEQDDSMFSFNVN